MSDNRRYVFVIGTGRCGSTLVQEVLARHPDVGFISNVDDRLARLDLRGRWNGPIYRRLPASFSQKGRIRFAPSEAYRLLDRHVSPLITTPFRDLVTEDATPWLADRFRRFFAERAAAQDVPLFLHKFTGWPRAGFIDAVFPNALFIHIVRDGRAVANSLTQMSWWPGHLGPNSWNWGPLPPDDEIEWEASGRSISLLAGIGWKILMNAFESAGQAFPDRWLELRYEDICADPRTAFEQMLSFMSLPWTRGFESGFSRHTFSTSRADTFRHDLDPDTARLLEQSLGTHLRRYGYPSSLLPTNASTVRKTRAFGSG